MNKVLQKNVANGEIIVIKNKNDVKKIDALIIPGGESTTISQLILKLGILDELLLRIRNRNLPIMGTCAGCVLLSSELENESKEIHLLKAINMKVLRNGFGRQKYSFEKKINITNFNKPFNAIFIRAPIIKNIWGNCAIYGKFENNIVFVRENIYLALSFHPELTNDLRIHEYFLKIIINNIKEK
jgi:5'-phosphate synthase pdxT subunit